MALFRKTGTIDPQFAALDYIFRDYMDLNKISAGSLAVVKSGWVAVHRGYTRARRQYPLTHPDSLFRLASLSKTFTDAAIRRLIEMQRLTLDTRVFPFLGLDAASTLPTGKQPAPRMDTITVRQLTNHSARLQRGIEGLEISNALGLSRPPTRNEIVRYVYGLPRLSTMHSKTGFHYSNYGYVILTSVIEKAANLDLVAFLHKEVLARFSDVAVWRALTPQHGALPGEVQYESRGLNGPSNFAPRTQELEPLAYGGLFTLENSEGPGGLVSTALTVARLISAYAVWGVGPRALAARTGGFPGTATTAISYANGYDVAYFFNVELDDHERKPLADALDAFFGAL